MDRASTIPFKKAKVIESRVLASKFVEVILQTETPMSFQAGQYISVKVAEDRINAYSLAAKRENNQLVLLIDVSPGGPGSKYFESIKAGEELSFLGPFGTFLLKPNDGAGQLVFLGTGTGCAPLRAMMETALTDEKITKPIFFYFGLRFETDVFWQDYFEGLAKTYSNFHYKLVLSKPSENWPGASGHITDIIKKDFTNFSDLGVYLCGNKSMIEEAKTILLESGCPVTRIYKEEMF